jgi:signal transduction histidine kinase
MVMQWWRGGDAMATRWRCDGNVMAMRWRDGDAMVALWRCDGDAMVTRWLMRWLKMLAVLFVIAVNLIVAFFIANAIIFRLTGTPRPLFAFLLTCFIGYAMLLATLRAIHGFAYRAAHAARESMRQSDAQRASLLDAILRISQGDFDVFLRVDREDAYGDIAEGINNMARQLGTIENMRQDFISNVSHEMQSPLTSISGFASLLKKGALSEEQRIHYLDIIEKESRRLSSLSDNLLKLSALETGNAPLAVGEFRLDKQLQTVALMLEPQWAAKKLAIEAVLDRTVYYGDESLLSQVWVNLIHNAIKFTPNGGTVRISLSSAGAPESGEICCAVSDTGIGISQEDQIRIFERFYKVDKARDRSMGGNGLGLSLAKKIVELHGGRVAISSEFGSGATFSVFLPLPRLSDAPQ